MTRLAHVVGLVVGYAGVSLALRMADAVDALVLEAAQQAAEAAEQLHLAPLLAEQGIGEEP